MLQETQELQEVEKVLICPTCIGKVQDQHSDEQPEYYWCPECLLYKRAIETDGRGKLVPLNG